MIVQFNPKLRIYFYKNESFSNYLFININFYPGNVLLNKVVTGIFIFIFNLFEIFLNCVVKYM